MCLDYKGRHRLVLGRSCCRKLATKLSSCKTLKILTMDLGAFSISLAVKDLAASKAFYEDLGFVSFGGDASKNFLIMKNGNALVGLFEGMFENNILTFNPGWDESAQETASYDDVRAIQQQLKQKGRTLMNETDPSGEGPASFMIADPDGNVILVDQHRS